jgi:glycosyltransferase involved in cell wall biosynthesis
VVEKTIEKYNLNFDLIHAHFTWPSGYIGVRLKEKYGTPVIITIHENGEWFDQEVGMDHHFINSAWSGADALIRVNQKDVPVLKRFNKHVYSIPNGVSSAFYPIDILTAKRRLGLPTDKTIVFALGNLIKRKGFDYLIDAMDLICHQRNDVLCYIGGSGSEYSSLQRRIDKSNLKKKVRLIGPIPGDQLNVWMNACDLFVLPSLSESFGIVQIEALACGKPVVSARNRGSREIIDSEDYGLLADPANSKDLAEIILVALGRKWNKEKILEHAEHYKWEYIAKKILNVYKTILI